MAKKRKSTATPSNPKPEEEKETPKIPKTEQKPDKKEEPKKPDKKEEEPPKKPVKEEEPKKQPEETKQIEQKQEEEEEEEEESEEEESEEEEESSESSEEEEEEEESEETKRENLKKLLEPFSKDQIIEFIKEAALKDPSIVANITNSARSDPSNRKIFVFGLGWDATSDQLLNAFKPFGEIEECKLVTDKVTRRAKGYAFLQFKTLKSTKRALKEPQKKIGNRVTTCQLASAGGVGSGSGSGGGSVPEGRRLYVGNVGPQVNPEKIKSFFAKFGEIEEGPIGIDSVTGKFKGYAIFVYKTVEGFKKALEEPFKLFDGVQFQCRPANKNQPPGNAVAAAPQQSSTPGVNYGLNVNPAFNPAALMMAQNQGIGVTNPLMGLAGNGFGPSMGYGLGGMGAGMIGGYNQAALQAMSAYQSAQLGQSSGGATPVSGVGPRAQTGLGSLGNTGLGSHGSTGYGSLGSSGYGSLGSSGYGSLGSTGLGSLGNTYPSFGR